MLDHRDLDIIALSSSQVRISPFVFSVLPGCSYLASTWFPILPDLTRFTLGQYFERGQ